MTGGDGLVHIERPRHHLTLCDGNLLTRGWPTTVAFPTCFMCIGLLDIYWVL